MLDIKKIQSILGSEIKNKDFFETAFTHRSYLNENRNSAKEHNERLEFLGDAILELIVTEYLYNNYKEPEGILTNWRSALVNGKMLSSIADELGFQPMLRLSHGEAKSINKSKKYILANTFEAFIGATYLDLGYDAAKNFINKYVIVNLERIIKEELYIDSKSKLQEYTQEHFSITPNYKIISEIGPDHNKEFISAVYLKEKKLAEGSGSSKQASEQKAAANALKDLNKEDE